MTNYDETFRVRCTSEQLAQLDADAKASGMKTPELARLRLFGSPTRSTFPSSASAASFSGTAIGSSTPIDYVTKSDLDSAVESAVTKALDTIKKGK